MRLAVVAAAAFATACAGPAQNATAPSRVSPPVTRPASLSAPLDDKAVAAATGVETVEALADGVMKVSFPRQGLVAVDGWSMPPFMGVTSWAAFSRGRAGVAEAMVMGDLVLLEDEVNPVMSVLLDAGLEITALHNHFFFDTPRVYFMHIGGEGSIAALGNGVRAAIEKTRAIRKSAPSPASRSGAPPLPAASAIDASMLEAALGFKGQAKDGMFKATVGRKATASCGCSVGKAMGVSTWAAFAGTDEVAVVDGDFAVLESELRPVLASLRAGGVDVVAIHHHMTGETPRILFVHYWGRGRAADLAAVVRRTLALTAHVAP
ncbi:MAG: DUF1259 domain-containing protein [Labilithrix sp.]|nr:DUF1259 domain-containing protein [Labilithrix sp.]